MSTQFKGSLHIISWQLILVQAFELIIREQSYVCITSPCFWGDHAVIKVSTLCLTPHKVYPLLLHQMVLEDNIAAQFSSLSFTVITVREHFTPVNWYLYCINKTADVLTICPWFLIFANDHYKCNVSFFRRIWALLLLLLLCQSTAALTSMCLSLHKDFFKKKTWTLQLKHAFFFSLLIYLFVSQDMLDAFEAIQGKFRQIRSQTRRQKDHLKRFHGGNDTSNGNINIF